MEQNISNITENLRRFGVADYVVFGLMLLICAVIGVYFGFFAGVRSADEYLMGGRNMGVIPISMSLIASTISGVTLVGAPTETYIYGIQYVYICFGATVMAILLAYGFLPVFHELHLTSAYEYLLLRFGKEARLVGSALFAIGIITWIPVVMYVPALVFNQVTGINIHVITPLMCLICIFYTCVGGLKAVVWTDVVQSVAMFGSSLLVIFKGTADVGGFGVVWSRNVASGRIEPPNLSLDPFERHTLWAMTIGGAIMWLEYNGMSQMMMQRYLSLPSIDRARRSVGIFVVGAIALIFICAYSGLVIYATYHDCDPLTTKLAVVKDQLLPLMVMNTLGSLPGLPGCFVAGVFSAALSSMSTAMNSMAAVVLEDFYKTFFKKPLTERQTNILMKSVVVVTGVICLSLVFIVEKLGTILQLTLSLGSVTNGPSLGLFITGLFLPWVNTKGMLIGSASGVAIMSWIVFGSQAAIATGGITFPTKPLTAEGCSYSFSTPTPPLLNVTDISATSGKIFPLYRVSYMWYTAIGMLVSTLVALITSFITGANDPTSVDPKLLSPFVRRLFFSVDSTRQKTTIQQSTRANEYKSVEMQIIAQPLTVEEKEKEDLLQ